MTAQGGTAITGPAPTPSQRPASESRPGCLFCSIVRGDSAAAKVFEDDDAIAFLDHRPVFHGHVLLVPRKHIETIVDLPDELVGPLFADARLLAGAVQQAMEADGTFLAINNRVSQSVPHLHVHVVPRKRGDGLRGFMWPRTKYRDDHHVRETASAIQDAAERIRRRR